MRNRVIPFCLLVVAAIVLFTSLLAVVYVWRVVEAAYFDKGAESGDEPSEAPWPMVAAAWALAIACIIFGLTTDLTVGIAREAATLLLGAS